MESQTIQELEALTPTEMDAGLVFSGVPTGNKIWGYQNPCLYTPAIDPHYSFHESARDAAVWFMNKLDPLYLYGPTGSGKDEPHQTACRTFELSGVRSDGTRTSRVRGFVRVISPSMKGVCGMSMALCL